LKNGKWIKVIVWHGKVNELECREHWYAWSGRIPCTGIKRCLLCGKPDD
jgi:hypothetical protein